MSFLEFIGLVAVIIGFQVWLHYFILWAVIEAIKDSMPWPVEYDHEKIGEVYKKRKKDNKL